MKGKIVFSKHESEMIIALIKEKLKSDTVKQKGIRAKIRKLGFYASDFGLRDGYTVDDFIRAVKLVEEGSPTAISKPILKNTTNKSNRPRGLSDEAYIIDLCDEILGIKASRQHYFDFLTGDTGRKLPVDAFYERLNLVVEYCEKQHTEAVGFFDKRITASGISRGEQRKKYDERRRVLLPQNNIVLIEFDYSEFGHNRSKRLLRNIENDQIIIKSKLSQFI